MLKAHYVLVMWLHFIIYVLDIVYYLFGSVCLWWKYYIVCATSHRCLTLRLVRSLETDPGRGFTDWESSNATNHGLIYCFIDCLYSRVLQNEGENI